MVFGTSRRHACSHGIFFLRQKNQNSRPSSTCCPCGLEWEVCWVYWSRTGAAGDPAGSRGEWRVFATTPAVALPAPAATDSPAVATAAVDPRKVGARNSVDCTIHPRKPGVETIPGESTP